MFTTTFSVTKFSMDKYFFPKKIILWNRNRFTIALSLSRTLDPTKIPFNSEPFPNEHRKRRTNDDLSAEYFLATNFEEVSPNVCRDRRCCVINVTERSRAIFSRGRNRPGSDHVQPITGRIRRCLFTRLVYNGAPPRNDYRRSTIEGFIVPFAGRLSNSRWLTTRETEREGSNAP